MLYFKFKAVRGHQILNCSQHLGAVKKGAAKQSRINQTILVRTRSDIMLWPSRLEYYHDQSVRQQVRTRTDIKLRPSKCSIIHEFSLYLAIAMQ